MSNIKQSLENLSASIGNLEASLQLIEESAAQASNPGQQQDMFSNGMGKAVSDKLNRAIEHVEKMLGETQ